MKKRIVQLACVAMLMTVTASAQVNLKFADDFSGDLSAWLVQGGSWSIQEGVLQGYYDIRCGSIWCPQGDIIPQDAYQPETEDWRIEMDFTYISAGCCDHWQSYASVILWSDYWTKTQLSAGWAGYGWAGGPRDSIATSMHTWYPWSQSYSGIVPLDWSPLESNRFALEKRGDE